MRFRVTSPWSKKHCRSILHKERTKHVRRPRTHPRYKFLERLETTLEGLVRIIGCRGPWTMTRNLRIYTFTINLVVEFSERQHTSLSRAKIYVSPACKQDPRWLGLTSLSNAPHSVLAIIFPLPAVMSLAFVKVDTSSTYAAFVPVPNIHPTKQSPTAYERDSNVPTVWYNIIDQDTSRLQLLKRQLTSLTSATHSTCRCFRKNQRSRAITKKEWTVIEGKAKDLLSPCEYKRR